MRYEGRLTKWNAERGFGFIAAQDSGQDVFVHIKAFPHDGRQPVVGEMLSFEIEPDGKGKKRAVWVRRTGDEAPARARSARQTAVRLSRTPNGASPLGKWVVLALLVAVAWFGYSRYAARVASFGISAPDVAAPMPLRLLPGSAKVPIPADFRCDGRTHCSQMTSCREATLFLQNCPGMKMDGNGDGVPCEQQWCN